MSKFRGDLLSVGLDCKGAQKNFLDTRSSTMTYAPQRGEEGEVRLTLLFLTDLTISSSKKIVLLKEKN
jgi:hypothetical protein